MSTIDSSELSNEALGIEVSSGEDAFEVHLAEQEPGSLTLQVKQEGNPAFRIIHLESDRGALSVTVSADITDEEERREAVQGDVVLMFSSEEEGPESVVAIHPMSDWDARQYSSVFGQSVPVQRSFLTQHTGRKQTSK